MVGDSCIKNEIVSSSFDTHSFCDFEKKVLSAYCVLHDRVFWRKATDGGGVDSFESYLNYTLETMATSMSQGVTVLQQYLKALKIYSYKANAMRGLLKKRNEGGLKRALETENVFLFSGA